MAATTSLLAFVDDVIDDDLLEDLRRVVSEARATHKWSLGPPEFIDTIEDGVRTVGCELRLYATIDEDGAPIGVEADAASLEDVKALIALLAPLSKLRHVDIGFELGGASSGWLMEGEPDRLLATGLVGEWEAHIRKRSPSEQR